MEDEKFIDYLKNICKSEEEFYQILPKLKTAMENSSKWNEENIIERCEEIENMGYSISSIEIMNLSTGKTIVGSYGFFDEYGYSRSLPHETLVLTFENNENQKRYCIVDLIDGELIREPLSRLKYQTSLDKYFLNVSAIENLKNAFNEKGIELSEDALYSMFDISQMHTVYDDYDNDDIDIIFSNLSDEEIKKFVDEIVIEIQENLKQINEIELNNETLSDWSNDKKGISLAHELLECGYDRQKNACGLLCSKIDSGLNSSQQNFIARQTCNLVGQIALEMIKNDELMINSEHAKMFGIEKEVLEYIIQNENKKELLKQYTSKIIGVEWDEDGTCTKYYTKNLPKPILEGIYKAIEENPNEINVERLNHDLWRFNKAIKSHDFYKENYSQEQLEIALSEITKQYLLGSIDNEINSYKQVSYKNILDALNLYEDTEYSCYTISGERPLKVLNDMIDCTYYKEIDLTESIPKDFIKDILDGKSLQEVVSSQFDKIQEIIHQEHNKITDEYIMNGDFGPNDYKHNLSESKISHLQYSLDSLEDFEKCFRYHFLLTDLIYDRNIKRATDNSNATILNLRTNQEIPIYETDESFIIHNINEDTLRKCYEIIKNEFSDEDLRIKTSREIFKEIIEPNSYLVNYDIYKELNDNGLWNKTFKERFSTFLDDLDSLAKNENYSENKKLLEEIYTIENQVKFEELRDHLIQNRGIQNHREFTTYNLAIEGDISLEKARVLESICSATTGYKPYIVSPFNIIGKETIGLTKRMLELREDLKNLDVEALSNKYEFSDYNSLNTIQKEYLKLQTLEGKLLEEDYQLLIKTPNEWNNIRKSFIPYWRDDGCIEFVDVPNLERIKEALSAKLSILVKIDESNPTNVIESFCESTYGKEFDSSKLIMNPSEAVEIIKDTINNNSFKDSLDFVARLDEKEQQNKIHFGE